MFVVLSDHEIGLFFFVFFSDIRLIFDGCVLSYDKVSELFVCTMKCPSPYFAFSGQIFLSRQIFQPS